LTPLLNQELMRVQGDVSPGRNQYAVAIGYEFVSGVVGGFSGATG
jgi:hypothetical protein